MRWLAVLPFAALLVACDGTNADHAINADEYDRACTGVADCVPVYSGSLSCCSNQPCPTTAIRQDNLAKYESSVAARMPMCMSPTPGDCRPTPGCTGRIQCVAGTCTLVGAGTGGGVDAR